MLKIREYSRIFSIFDKEIKFDAEKIKLKSLFLVVH